MEIYRSIKKFRDKQGKITGYRLVDTTGKTMDITSSDLKQAIKNQQVEVENLTLTSDDRLIDKPLKLKLNIKQNKHKPVNIKLNLSQAQVNNINANNNYVANSTNRALANGGSITNLRGGSIAIDMPHAKELYIIVGNNATNTMDINAFMKKYNGNNYEVKVVGGQNLTSTGRMFMDCRAQTIDLSNFDPSNVSDMGGMGGMFYNCNAEVITDHGRFK